MVKVPETAQGVTSFGNGFEEPTSSGKARDDHLASKKALIAAPVHSKPKLRVTLAQSEVIKNAN
eukprot:3957337-Prorocentrum_lima.AAC.1